MGVDLLRTAVSAAIILLARAPQPPTGAHILGSQVRRRIMDAIKEKPGLTLSELRDRVNLGWGNAYHHICKLERAGLLKKTRAGRRLVILPTDGAMEEHESQARAYLRGETARQICQDIANHPGTDVASISARLGHSRRAAYYHARELTRLGLVASRSQTRQFALHVTPLYASIRA